MWQEFKEFAFKGNVIDLAVGVMIGSAFTGIVTSIVNDLFTPLLSLATNGINFSSMGAKIGEGENAAVFAYGNFIQTVINFFLVAICIFIFVKFINRLKKKPAPAPAVEPRKCEFCYGVIDEKATRCPHCTSMLEAHA
ncbi:MAG: large conductance mechanosensitive channel protein MscL [Christensenellales bacterium]